MPTSECYHHPVYPTKDAFATRFAVMGCALMHLHATPVDGKPCQGKHSLPSAPHNA